MPKVKRLKLSRGQRSQNLEQQIHDESRERPTGRVKQRPEKTDGKFVDEKLSRIIIDEARKQQEDEFERPTMKGMEFVGLKQMGDQDSDDDLEEDCQDYYEDIAIDPEDEKAIERFMSKDVDRRRTIADLIQEKLTEKQTELRSQFSDTPTALSPQVVALYKGVKTVLANYKSGRIPKAFKIIGSLPNWLDVLLITDPNGWTAAAMYQATRIFSSNLKDHQAQRFYNVILLPRIRDDIQEFRRLNFHLYQALRKALFKPGAFFKGIVLPLCESKDCTLREAVIIATVLNKSHVPLMHSGAALIKLAEMDYSGVNSVFLNTLIGKKYALPFRVIDAIVHHFLKFMQDKRLLPVLWHQALLSFAQTYKSDISSEQKETLLELLRFHVHHQMTPVIREELRRATPRDVEMVEEEKTSQ